MAVHRVKIVMSLVYAEELIMAVRDFSMVRFRIIWIIFLFISKPIFLCFLLSFGTFLKIIKPILVW